ncbi:hypothetical protein DBR42_07945 [Pelomonas sp. HMWF004]|nr:hypothetical protein DBR42_07945 [Pelomonas sp. HMWF004]
MLEQFTEWLARLVKAVINALWQFLVDLAISLVDAILSVLVGLIALIPVPSWLSQGLQGFYSALDPGIAYILGVTGMPVALAMIGTGYAFRLGRKVATLFQW